MRSEICIFRLSGSTMQPLWEELLFSKSDLQSAFRQLPIRKEDLDLLGLKHQGLYYLDLCLPFGVSIACRVFETFSTALHWKVGQLIADILVHYLDDFHFGGSTWESCVLKLDTFREVCDTIGFPISEDKTVGPTQKLVFLGLGLNTITQTVSIPEDKVRKAMKAITDFLSRKKAKLKMIQSVTGLLNFFNQAIRGGKTIPQTVVRFTIDSRH